MVLDQQHDKKRFSVGAKTRETLKMDGSIRKRYFNDAKPPPTISQYFEQRNNIIHTDCKPN